MKDKLTYINMEIYSDCFWMAKKKLELRIDISQATHT